MLALAPKLSTVGNIIILPLITPYLSRADYGLFGTIIAYTAVFSSIATLGLNAILPNYYFERTLTYKLLWKVVLGLLLTAGFIFSIIVAILLIFALSNELSNDLPVVIIICCIPFLTRPVELIGQLYLILSEKTDYVSIVLIVSGLIGTLSTLLAIKVFNMGYIGLLINLFSVSLTSFFFYAYLVFIKEKMTPIFRYKLSSLKSIFNFSFPIVLHNLSLNILSSSDRIVLDIFKVPIRTIGSYTQAFSFGSLFNSVIQGGFRSLTTKNQTKYRSEDIAERLDMGYYFKIITILLIGIIFLVSIWFREIYAILFRNPELQTNYSFAIIIVFSLSLRPLYILSTIPIMISKKTKYMLIITGIPATLNLIFNLIFIPKYGVSAALVSTLFTFILMSLIGFFIGKVRSLLVDFYSNLYQYLGIPLILSLILFIASIKIVEMQQYHKFLITALTFLIFGVWLMRIRPKLEKSLSETNK